MKAYATISTEELTADMLINVCDACLQASCWLGEFYRDKYKAACVVKLPVWHLRALNRESPDYWAKEIRSRYGRP